jgi:hypothetical protein
MKSLFSGLMLRLCMERRLFGSKKIPTTFSGRYVFGYFQPLMYGFFNVPQE